MIRSRSLVVLQLSLVLCLISLCGCGGVNGGNGGGGNGNAGPSQAIIAFGAQPGAIVQGQSTTLSWNVTNAASFSISPAVGTGTLPMSGSATVSPAQNTTYVATATDANGRSTSFSISVVVVPAGSAPTISLSFQPTITGAGQPAVISWTSTNALSVSITPSIFTEDQTTLALSGSAHDCAQRDNHL